MKKLNILLLCIGSSLITGIVGYIIGIKHSDNVNLNKQEKNIVGTYKTDSWNEKNAVLALKSDKTCIHPDNIYTCSYSISDEKITLNLIEPQYTESYIEIYLNNEATELDRGQLEYILRRISEFVEKLDYVEDKKMYKLVLMTLNSVDEAYNELENIKNKYNIKDIKKYKGELIEVNSKQIATIVDGGILLNDIFFEKLK